MCPIFEYIDPQGAPVNNLVVVSVTHDALFRRHPVDAPSLIAKCFLFRNVPEDDLEPIAEIAETVHAAAGETIFFAEDEGDGMYLIRLGSVSVQKDGNELARLGTGSHFGEIALLDGEPRSATIRALEHTEMLKLSRDRFIGTLRSNQGLASAVYREFCVYLSKRLRRTDEQLAFFKERSDS